MSKTIKSLFVLCAATFVLSACTSTSTTSDTASTSDSSSANSSGSNAGSVSTTEKAVSLATVFYFDFDSSSLRADSRKLLDAHAAALKASPRAIRLEGHADERGTREYNIALGERRAQAVRAYLVARGVTSSIEVVSYGEERPAVDQSNEYAWQQNRRVEIK